MKTSKTIPSSNFRSATFTAAGLALAAGAAVLLGSLSEEVVEGETSRFDTYVRGVVHAWSSSRLTGVMWLFTDLGSVLVTACLLTAAVVVFWLCKWRLAALTLALTMAGSVVLEQALKLGFHRQRPSPYFGISSPHSFSYPSGHALFSFALFVTVAALLSARFPGPLARAAIWTTAGATVGMIGLSRVYLGVHYPTDVAAGYLAAFIWVLTVSVGRPFYASVKQEPRQ